MRFDELGLTPELMKALANMQYEELTPIQEVTFKPIMERRDIVGVAETGSGKTSACGVPLVQEIDTELNAIQVLVLVPTRELALQYVDEIDRLSKFSGISCFTIFGGFPMAIQEAKLRHGVQMLVATPGRLIDCIYNSQSLSLEHVKTVVLDEADEMLDQGFIEDVQFILSCVRNEHNTLLFSATMPAEIKKLIAGFLKDPITIELNKERKAPQSLVHTFKSINPRERTEELKAYLKEANATQVIVFCNTRKGAVTLHGTLKRELDSIEVIQGGLAQNVRTRIFNSFKAGKIKYMIATDVAGRGLDFSKVTHVINYELPKSLIDYTHRTGRAGRMGRKGTALTLVTRRDAEKLGQLFRRDQINPQWLGEEMRLDGGGAHKGGHKGGGHSRGRKSGSGSPHRNRNRRNRNRAGRQKPTT